MSEDTADISTPSMSRRRLLQMMVAGGATMAMSGSLLAACGSDDDGGANASGAGNSGSSGAAPTSGGSSPSTADEFVIATDNEPGDMLPGWGGGFGAAIALQGIYQNLVEPRITIDESNTATVELESVLATGFEQVDDLRWRFTLREGVVFHNGEKFDANAVKTNFDMQTDEAFLSKYDRSNNLGQAIEACEVVDDMTVDFVAALPDSEIPNSRLRGLLFLPPKLLREQGFDPFVEKPMGTGPYKFESWTRGQDILLTRFEDYWDSDGPNMPAVRVIVRPEAAVRAQTVATGEAHLAYSIGGELAQTLEHSVVGGGFQSSGIRLNNTIEPTKNYNLRKAMNLAVDRQGIIDSIFLGAAIPLAFFGFQPVKLEPYPYDPDEAMRLIQEEGLEGTELELVYGENRIPEEPQLAEVYKAQFEAVGLKIKLTRMEPRQYNQVGDAEFTEQPPMFMETTSSGNSGEIGSGLRDKYGCEGSGTFCDPAMDKEFQELAALTGDEKNEKLQSIAERLHLEETSRIWVAAVQQVHGIAENVETNFAANTYVNIRNIRFK